MSTWRFFGLKKKDIFGFRKISLTASESRSVEIFLGSLSLERNIIRKSLQALSKTIQ